MARRKDSKNRVLNDNETEIFRNGKSIGYTYRWIGKDKKRHQKFASTLDELRKKEDKISITSYQGLQEDGDKYTINDYYRKWKNLKTGNKANTRSNYAYMYEHYVQSSFGKCKIKEVTNSDVKEFYKKLYDEKHLAPTTIDNINTCLLVVFKQAFRDDIIRLNPATDAFKEFKKSIKLEARENALKGKRKKNESLTVDEEKVFVDYLENTPLEESWKNIFIFMLETGLRVGEVTGLQHKDIDLDENLVYISKTLVYFDKYNESHHCEYEVHSTKTENSERAVPLTKKAREAYLAEVERQKKYGIKCLSDIDGWNDFIFLNRFGLVLNQGTLNKALRRIIKDCNAKQVKSNKGKDCVLLPSFSCHCTRHTFATRLHESGVKDNTIKTLLGHSDIRTTLNIYASSQKDFNAEQIEAYEDFKNNYLK